MSGSSAAAEINFLNLIENTAIGLRTDEVELLIQMTYDVKFFDPFKRTLSNQHMADEPRMASNIAALFAKWTFLEFTKTYAGARNPGCDLEARILVWLEAHHRVKSEFTPEEYLFLNLYRRFMQEYSSGKYKAFLPDPERGLTAAEARALRLGAFAQLDGWIRVVLSARRLTAKQRQDRQTLLDWIDENVRSLH